MNKGKSPRGMLSHAAKAIAWCLVFTSGFAISSVSRGQALNLGDASQFGLLTLSGGIQLSGNAEALNGNIGVAASGSSFQMSGQTIVGSGESVYVHSGSMFQNSSNGSSQNLQASMNDALLNQASTDAMNAANFGAQLGSSASFRASQGFTLGGTYGAISQSTSISEASAGNYVYNIGSINLGGNSDLTISAPSTSKIVLDISGSIQLNQTSGIILSGVKSGNVVFDIIGNGNVNLSGNSIMYGSILAPQSSVQLSGQSYAQGQVVASSIQESGASQVISPDY